MSEIQDKHQEGHFDLRPLLRLVLWGGAALGALLLAILAANSDTGRKQLVQAREALIGPLAPPVKPAMPTAAQLLVRSQDAEAEARRLADAVRVLSADRDRLMARIGALERTIEDVTGSIAAERNAQRDAAIVKPSPPVSAAPLPPIAAIPTPANATSAVTQPPNATPAAVSSQVAAAIPAPSPVAAHFPPPSVVVPPAPPSNANAILPPSIADKPTGEPQRATQEPVRAVAVEPVAPATAPSWATAMVDQPVTMPSAAPLPPATRSASTEAVSSKTEYAVDIGGAADIDALRELWLAAKDRFSSLEALRPAVAVRDNGKQPGPAELRLVMGPIPNAPAAAKLCASLSASGLSCYPTVFDGQRTRLALTARRSERLHP